MIRQAADSNPARARGGAGTVRIERQPSIIPPVESFGSVEPDAAVLSRQDSTIRSTGETLPSRVGDDRKFAEAIETVYRCRPNIAFPIFKKTKDVIAGQSVGL